MSLLRWEINKVLQKIKAGDERYKEVLFKLTYNHLKIVARRYLANKDDADDVLQLTYLRVFKYIGSFDVSKDGYNWLCKILQNEAYKYNKENALYLPLENHIDNAGTVDVEEWISIKDELYRYLKDYSEKDCRLIYLRVYDGYTYAKIAEIMHMKKSNVHRRLTKIFEEILEKRRKELEKSER